MDFSSSDKFDGLKEANMYNDTGDSSTSGFDFPNIVAWLEMPLMDIN